MSRNQKIDFNLTEKGLDGVGVPDVRLGYRLKGHLLKATEKNLVFPFSCLV
jgi:hypothetical protein